VPAAAARLTAGISLGLAGALCVPLVSFLGAAFRDRLTRRWARAVLRAFGVRIRVTGTPGPRQPAGVLIAANHISWLDPLLLAAVLPGRNLAKSEIRRWPVLGGLAARGGTLFVEREGPRALPAMVRTLAEALREGSRVVVFPEATTRCGREQGPFAPAVFQAALDAGAGVRPAHIAYRTSEGRFSGAPAFVGDDTLAASLWRVVRAGGLTADLTLLPPIAAGRHTAGRHTGRRSLAEAARAAVASAQTAVASESANLPPSSVHQCVSSMPEEASSARTPS
jgi:1-acyl-sn-glycerol-3-phosphate acyltransferase